MKDQDCCPVFFRSSPVFFRSFSSSETGPSSTKNSLELLHPNLSRIPQFVIYSTTENLFITSGVVHVFFLLCLCCASQDWNSNMVEYSMDDFQKCSFYPCTYSHSHNYANTCDKVTSVVCRQIPFDLRDRGGH